MPSATILGGIAGPDLTAAERDFFRAADPWGFILFGRNIDTPDRLRRLTADLRDTLGRDAPILIDQEGGRVQRMRAPHWTEFRPLLEQAALGERAVWLHHRLLGQELRAMGIDANCAPVLDLATEDTHPFLRNRCLGPDPETVARLGRGAGEALLEAGLRALVKTTPLPGPRHIALQQGPPVGPAGRPPCLRLAAFIFTPLPPFRSLGAIFSFACARFSFGWPASSAAWASWAVWLGW